MVARIVFIVLCIFVLSINVFSLQWINLHGALNFIGNSDNRSSVSPIVPSAGISSCFFINPNIYFRTGLDFSGTDYMYNDEDRILPAEIENREMYVFMTTLDSIFGFRLVLSDWIELGAELGPSFVFRLPIALFESTDTSKGMQYFYDNARFLYPGGAFYIKWNMTDSFGLIFGARALVPVFHFWDGENLPLWDQMFISGRIDWCFTL